MRDASLEPIGVAGTVLDLFLETLESLRRVGISYCYWRSGRRLEAALAGLSDLDLLVARGDRERVVGLLLEHGFKLFSAVPAHDEPALLDLVGYDAPSGRLVHVHLHFRLLLGPSLLKPWQPPWHDFVLAHAVWHRSLPVRVLDAPTEAVLLLVRSCLEFNPLDVVALRRRRAMAAKFAADRAALAPRLDRREVSGRAAALLGGVMAERVADAVYRDEPPSSALRRQVRAQLAPYRGAGPLLGNMRLLARSLSFLGRSLNKRLIRAPRPWSRRIAGGGMVVAVLGVDGSGKSTLVRALHDWTGTEMDALPLYFGTGEGRASLLLLLLKSLVPLAQRLLRHKPAGASHGTVSSKPPGLLYSALMIVWASALAVEKRTKLLAARRGAERGLLVIADRYPQDEDLTYNDGPLLPRLRWAPRRLRAFEARSYALARRLPPDLVIKLHVLAETAARREPDMDPLITQARIASLRHLTFPGARVVSVDAEQVLDDVVRNVKQAVWRAL